MGCEKFKKEPCGPDIFKRTAFTLIELLIALTIFSVIAASAYSAFNAGLFAWKKLSVTLDGYQNTAAALDFMGKEISSYIPSSKVVFEGSADKITFLSRVENEGRYDLKKTSFYWDEASSSLMQSEEPIKSAMETDLNKKEIATQELSSRIKALEFKYFCRKTDSEKEYEWLDFFDPKKIQSCRAVSISISSGLAIKKTVYLYAEVKGAQSK